MFKEKKSAIVNELILIANRNKGLLRPADVVEAARPVDSPLHSRFTWDDTEAAHQYRLWQAREIIRVSVEYLPLPEGNTEIKAFVSLTPDREIDGGGYRRMVTVMTDKEDRAQLLEDAVNEMNIFRNKYRGLKELADVFSAMTKVQIRHLK